MTIILFLNSLKCHWLGLGFIFLTATSCFGPGDISFDREESPDVATSVGRFEGSPVVTLVKVRLNDQIDTWMALDSGAEISILDKSIADELTTRRIAQVGAGSCSMPVTLVRAGSLSIGQHITKNPLFGVINLEATGLLEGLVLESGIRIGGIIGAPLFESSIVDINYAQDGDYVSVYDPKTYTLPQGNWQAIRFIDGHPFIEIRFEGDNTAWFLLDTGKSGALSFKSQYSEYEALIDERELHPEPNRRLCGEATELVGSLTWIEVGGLRIDSVRVAFKPPGSLGDDQMSNEAGNLGQGILRHFRLVTDLPRKRVALIQR